jgi:hypothetical protein
MEVIRNARERINPEGFAASTAISTASWGTFIPMEAGITYTIHEIAQQTDPNALKIAIAGGLGIANAASIALEARALRRKQYSASPVGTTLNIATGRPLISSVGEHVLNNVQLNLMNPINAVALLNNDPQLLSESVAATSFAITLWAGPINHLIAEGKADPLINTMKRVRQATWGRFKTNWKLANALVFGA